jgi:TP901 family phage tail tape measure protein
MARRALEIVITGDSRGASRAFRGVEQQAGTLTGRLKGVGGAAARAFGAFGAAYTAQAAIRAVATQTIEFDKSMRNVNSIAQLNEKQFGKLSKEVLKLAGPTAQAPQTLAEGLYDLVSSGFDSAESLTILESSARAATAGLTTTEVSTKAVAAVLNSYQLPAKSAAKVSDQLFRTVDRGVISFEDLASGVGDVLPFAASLNVGLDQVGASTATMTKAGISSSETMTRLKAIFSTMLKPGEDLANQIKSLGFESGETMVNQLGLQKTLEKLSGSVGGNKSAIAQLFPNVRALGGVLALTGKNAAGANADLLGMKDASGATAKALSQQSKSISYQWQKLKAQASVMAIEFGQKLVPAAKEVLAALSDDSLSGTEKLQKIGNVLTKQVTVAAGKIPDIVAKVAPAVLKSGAVLGVALLKGMVKGFAESDILGKLLIGGALIRLIGGKGALLKTGATMGSMLGGSMGLTAGTSFMARFADYRQRQNRHGNGDDNLSSRRRRTLRCRRGRGRPVRQVLRNRYRAGHPRHRRRHRACGHRVIGTLGRHEGRRYQVRRRFDRRAARIVRWACRHRYRRGHRHLRGSARCQAHRRPVRWGRRRAGSQAGRGSRNRGESRGGCSGWSRSVQEPG